MLLIKFTLSVYAAAVPPTSAEQVWCDPPRWEALTSCPTLPDATSILTLDMDKLMTGTTRQLANVNLQLHLNQSPTSGPFSSFQGVYKMSRSFEKSGYHQKIVTQYYTEAPSPWKGPCFRRTLHLPKILRYDAVQRYLPSMSSVKMNIMLSLTLIICV